MIGTGLQKLAKQHGMTVSCGVAYGTLKGYATTFSEGAGYKRIDITTKFTEPGQQEQLQAALNAANLNREYRVQNVGFGSRWISIIFNDTIGTMKKVEAFIDWFYPLLEQHGAVGANVCMECGAEVTVGSWYLINGFAYHFHDSCAEHIQGIMQEQAQQRREEDTGSYAQGLLGALGGAVLGAAVWAIVLYMGYVASIVGLLIGWLAEKGYNLLHGKQGKGKVVILIIAIIFGVLLGTIVPDVVMLAQMIDAGELPGYVYGDIPYLIVFLLGADTEYLGATVGNMFMGLLFAALGVFTLLRKTSKEVSDEKIKKLN